GGRLPRPLCRSHRGARPNRAAPLGGAPRVRGLRPEASVSGGPPHGFASCPRKNPAPARPSRIWRQDSRRRVTTSETLRGYVAYFDGSKRSVGFALLAAAAQPIALLPIPWLAKRAFH